MKQPTVMQEQTCVGALDTPPVSVAPAGDVPFWDQPLAELYKEVEGSSAGLTAAEAARRLTVSGPNEFGQRGAGAMLEILRFFANPLVLILLVAALISALTSEYLNAGLIGLIVLLSVTLNFVQAYRSRQAADRLRRAVVTTATVCRDGQWVEVPQREVVPGDVVRLAAGDLVPADARLLAAHDLFVNEAALTGESLPAEKMDGPQPGRHGPADADNAVFLGTSVISGTA